MKSLKPKEIIKILENRGFVFIRQKGSHRLYRKDLFRVTVPYHNKDFREYIVGHNVPFDAYHIDTVAGEGYGRGIRAVLQLLKPGVGVLS